MNPVTESSQLSGEGHFVPRARCVVELPTLRGTFEPQQHGPDGSDTNASGHQHRMRGALDEAKIVSRPADLQHSADGKLLVGVARAASAAGIALYAHDIAVRLVLGVDERILPH